MPELYPYQQVAAEWLAARPRAILADEMRVGKTPAAIRGADLVWALNVLWLTTGTARAGHAREWKRFQLADREVHVHYNSKGMVQPGVNIMSYDLMCQGLYKQVKAHEWDLIVCDESHFLQSATTRRTQALLGPRCAGNGLASKARHVWLLSGTPAPSHYGQLWPVLSGLFPETIPGRHVRVMSQESFTRSYTSGYKGQFGWVITGNRNAEKLADLLKPLVLRRTLAEVEPDLPPVRVSDWVVKAVDVPLSAMEKSSAFKRLREVDDAELTSSLARSASEEEIKNWRIATSYAKTPVVVQAIADEVYEGNEPRKYVVFVWHHATVQALQDCLKEKGLGFVTVTGGMTAPTREKQLQKFKEDGVTVLIGQVAAAGTAIDLSIANDIIFLEASWTPGENAQACLRCTNSKKRTPVTARFVSLDGSLDERLMRTIRRKSGELTQLWSQL